MGLFVCLYSCIVKTQLEVQKSIEQLCASWLQKTNSRSKKIGLFKDPLDMHTNFMEL